MISRGRVVKRTCDLVVSCAGLAVLAVPLLGVGVLVRLVQGPPVLFRQERIGEGGRPFHIIKFRTMRPESGNGSAGDAERLTRFGAFLRAWSLDELPELLNVIRGDMSLVGPRPLLPRYLPRYSAQQARRHEVQPGITGWAQVRGRNATTWEERLALDVWYVDHWSLKLDLRILWMTFAQVVRREGINANGHATMPEFLGTEDE